VLLSDSVSSTIEIRGGGEGWFGDGSGVCAAAGVYESGWPYMTDGSLDKVSDPGVCDDAELSGGVMVTSSGGGGLNVVARDVGVGEMEVVTELGRLVNIGFLSLP
jgi:hypothetical protein